MNTKYYRQPTRYYGNGVYRYIKFENNKWFIWGVKKGEYWGFAATEEKEMPQWYPWKSMIGKCKKECDDLIHSSFGEFDEISEEDMVLELL